MYMLVPLEWLADYVDLDLPVDDLALRMTMGGLNVDAVERRGQDWRGVVVGEVLDAQPHPSSRKPLLVTTVDVGGTETIIVTGADNVKQGDRVPVVQVGGSIPYGPNDETLDIVPRSMAGIMSYGMLASAGELGLTGESEGILILPQDFPVGVPLADVLGGVVLDIETNPNRPDTLSMIGVARDVAALTQQQATLPGVFAAGPDVIQAVQPSIAVAVEAPDLCPRYVALRIDGVRVDSSPLWLRTRIEAAGMRPINLIVDLTNYVMLESGQPLHAFDTRQIQGETIVVRRAHVGEQLQTLDGVDHLLTPDMLVIADRERAVAVAGVMGGQNSEIADDTTSIILESACFNPSSVRRTAKSLDLRTEASSRFEKGLPPEQAPLAAYRFLQLLVQVTATPLQVYAITDVNAGDVPVISVNMRLHDLRRISGVDIGMDTAAQKLSSLGFPVTIHDDALLSVDVPYWRRADIALPEDLIEEVVRLVGYENVPATLPHRTMPPVARSAADIRLEIVRERLLGIGITETMTGTLTSPVAMERLLLADGANDQSRPRWTECVVNRPGIGEHGAALEPIHLLNPPSNDRTMLRVSLLPSMLQVTAHNLKHTDELVAFFETAPTFFARTDELPYERPTLAIALAGVRLPRSWQHPAPSHYTFYDIKGVMEALCRDLGIGDYQVENGRHPALHPGRTGSLIVAGVQMATFGEVHPLVAQAYEIESSPVQLAEVDLDAIFSAASEDRRFRAAPRFPAAYRDLAVVVGNEVPAGEIVRLARNAGADMIESITIFDVYQGEPLLEGHKSIAFGMQLRGSEGTLTHAEIDHAMDRIVSELNRETGAVLRD